MGNESSQDRRMKELWQSQQTEGVRMSIDQIRISARKFQRKIKWRNAREYIAALVVVILFAFQFSKTEDPLVRIGFGLTIAGICYIVWQIHSKGSWTPLPKDVGMSSWLEFQRRELERQCELLSHIWRWYLGPLIPGLAVLLAAFGRANPAHLKHPSLAIALYAASFAAVFLFIASLNHRAARKIQRQIQELDEQAR
jgi:Flp pilus assembly protein TadB